VKKFTLLSLSLLVFLGCSPVLEDQTAIALDTVSRSLSGANVELLSVESYFHVYKSSLSQSRQFKIRVKDFGQGEEKNIIVHGELDSGAWMDISGADDAVYLGEAGEGFHLYEINLYDYIQPYIDNWGDSFVIKYVSDQGTFWDNNNGRNFTVESNDGMYLDESAGNVRLGTLAYGSGDYGSNLRGRIWTKDLGYDEKVEVVYTLDNWETVRVFEADYVDRYSYGYAGSVVCPNDHGVERWDYYIELEPNLDPSLVEVAVKYTAGGVGVFWDNNFDRNYNFD
jgi:hypothetical protein